MSKLPSYEEINLPIRVGIVGTGFAAKVRAQSLATESRTQLVAVAGRNPERTAEFAQSFDVLAVADWQTLVQMPDIDLVIVATINRLGEVHYARYSTIVCQRPIPEKWTFHRSEFGFPLMAALSRLHRFTDLFGSIESVNCNNQYWGGVGDYYKTCLCTAQLRFKNTNAIGEVVYGKGEGLWQNSRKFEVHGDKGALIFDGDEGVFIQDGTSTLLDLGARKGLFAKDLEIVLDCLIDGKPNYVTPAVSLATLRVADAARISAETRRTVTIDSL